jgi:2,4-diaminopentanoate dehydrogenase
MAEKYRVIHAGTGFTGLNALRQILTAPNLELVGLLVHTPSKIGADAADLCGLPPCGVLGTSSLDELYALEADCLTHLGSNPDIVQSSIAGSQSHKIVDECVGFLERGTNVSATSLTPLVWPHAWGQQQFDRLNDACQRGVSSFRNVGIHPGFTGDTLARLTAMSEEITQLRVQQCWNKGQYNEERRLRLLGFAADPTTQPGPEPGLIANKYACIIMQLADMIGFTIDKIHEKIEYSTAKADRVIPAFAIPAGTIDAIRVQVIGTSANREIATVDQVTRAYDEAAPHWPKVSGGDGLRFEVHGRPTLQAEIRFHCDGPTAVESTLATAALAVNAVSQICKAPPGVLSYANSLPVVGLGRFAVGDMD